jgi:hypothetical protein
MFLTWRVGKTLGTYFADTGEHTCKSLLSSSQVHRSGIQQVAWLPSNLSHPSSDRIPWGLKVDSMHFSECPTVVYLIWKRVCWEEEVRIGALYSNLWDPLLAADCSNSAFLQASVAMCELCRRTRNCRLDGDGERFWTVYSRRERSNRPGARCSLRDDMLNCLYTKMGTSGKGEPSYRSSAVPFLHALYQMHNRCRTDHVCLLAGCTSGKIQAISIKCHVGGQHQK